MNNDAHGNIELFSSCTWGVAREFRMQGGDENLQLQT